MTSQPSIREILNESINAVIAITVGYFKDDNGDIASIQDDTLSQIRKKIEGLKVKEGGAESSVVWNNAIDEVLGLFN